MVVSYPTNILANMPQFTGFLGILKVTRKLCNCGSESKISRFSSRSDAKSCDVVEEKGIDKIVDAHWLRQLARTHSA